MRLSPDEWILLTLGPVHLNATLVFTWVLMALLVLISRLLTRSLKSTTKISRGQNALEVLVMGMRRQVAEVAPEDADRILPFVGTLFVFVASCNLLAPVPGYVPPTSSLSTTAALALCVLIAVPIFGVRSQGLADYLRHYVSPTPLMLPFNLLGEVSRTVALAVRLFGNMMSAGLILAILLALVPFVLPVVMQLLGLLTGLVQAYVFAVLALIYIASASRAALRGESNAAMAEPTAQE